MIESNNNGARDWTSLSFDDGRQVLRQWREERVRRSEETVELWEHVLSRRPDALGDELWIIHEQVCIAALDCARLDVATECLLALQHKFASTHRVLKLQAMRFEALGRYDDASQLYDKLVTFDPTNAGYRKRQIAILKAQGHRIDAIKELNEYLKTFINDTEAWLEQCRNYLAECDYARAAHCMEELLLAQPHNSLYLQRYAEIKYAQGGFENVDTAKQYFVQSARTDTTNAMRSLYGILLCCQALVQHKSSTGGAPKRKDAIVVAQWAADRILERYAVDGIEAKNPNVADQRKCVKQMMKAITSTSST